MNTIETEKEIQQSIVKKMKTIGFSDSDIVNQAKNLGEIIILSVIKILLDNKKPNILFNNIEEPMDYVTANFSHDQISNVLEKEAEKIITNYSQRLIL